MTDRQANVLHMAHTIESVAHTDKRGLIELGPTDTYAEIVGVDLDTADELIEDAFKLLESEGVVITVKGYYGEGDYYMRDEYEEWKANEEDERRDWEQYQFDAMQAYGDNVMGGVYGY